MHFNGLASIVACGAAATVLVSGVSADAATLYREVFPNSTEPAAALTVGDAGWQILSSTGEGSGSIASELGKPTDLVPVNSAPSSVELARGFLTYSGTGGGTEDVLFYTEEFTIADALRDDLVSFSYYVANSPTAGAGRNRVAIRIGGNWYTSDTNIRNAQSNATVFADVAQQLVLDWATATWNSLDISGAPHAQTDRGTDPLPSGDITAFGVWLDNRGAGSSLRLDSYEIEVIPEPASLGLLGLGGALMLMRRRGR